MTTLKTAMMRLGRHSFTTPMMSMFTRNPLRRTRLGTRPDHPLLEEANPEQHRASMRSTAGSPRRLPGAARQPFVLR
ncbi:hypothetical protein ACIOTI_31245 [Streptomyces sp. NPDC087843]|uniref:hypothetical protein n=1 Tax=Streptomyces sp. NPDC087843 TaxID=3365804 RepID=UPI003813C162